MAKTKTKTKIIEIIYDRPGLTINSLCRALPQTTKYQIQRDIAELVGAGIIAPRPKGSHDGLVLTRAGTEAAEGGGKL